MTTSFGTLQTDGGRPRLSTNVFGVDIGNLVNNLVEAKKLPITAKEAQVEQNTTRIAALNDLKTLSKNLKDAALNLRAPSLSMGGSNVFNQKTATAQSSNGTSPASLLAITAKADAAEGQFTLNVNRKAREDVINSTGTFTAATQAPLTADGTLSLNGHNIALTSGMTLTDIKDAINAGTTTSKVRANIVQVNPTTFRLSLQGTATGDAIDLTGSSASVLTDLTVAASGQTDTTLSAELVYNGITVTRPTNSISDLVPDVTFDLFSADSAATLTVNVEKDGGAIKGTIENFVTAYNAFVDFNKEQRSISADGAVSESAVLFNDSTLRSIDNQLQSILSGAVGGASGINNLRAAGISFDNNNKLVIDNTKLDDTIINKPDELAVLFGFKSTASNSNAFVLGRPASLGELAGESFELRVLATDGTGRATSAELVRGSTTYTAVIDNGVIKAPDDSPLKGFSFGYLGGVVNSGDPARTTTFTATQGLADRIGGFLDDALSLQGGMIETAITEVQDRNDAINVQIARLEDQISLYRDRMTARFLATEQQVSVLSSMQESLKAQFEAMTADN